MRVTLIVFECLNIVLLIGASVGHFSFYFHLLEILCVLYWIVIGL